MITQINFINIKVQIADSILTPFKIRVKKSSENSDKFGMKNKVKSIKNPAEQSNLVEWE